MMAVIWTAWINGDHHASGSGYGFKIDAADRDRNFNRKWREVAVELPMRIPGQGEQHSGVKPNRIPG
jgi:hypothetical protein